MYLHFCYRTFEVRIRLVHEHIDMNTKVIMYIVDAYVQLVAYTYVLYRR